MATKNLVKIESEIPVGAYLVMWSCRKDEDDEASGFTRDRQTGLIEYWTDRSDAERARSKHRADAPFVYHFEIAHHVSVGNFDIF